MTDTLFPLGFVFTGPPSAGKTTTLEAIARLRPDWQTMSESARKVFEEAKAKGDPNITVKNRAFSDIVFLRQREREKPGYVDRDRICIFDRGLLDPLGYKSMDGETIPEATDEQLTNRYNLVFLFDPLPEQVQDGMRDDMAQTAQIQEALRAQYLAHGHTVIPVPFGTVEERATFVMDMIEQAAGLKPKTPRFGAYMMHFSPASKDFV
ncbi:MAG: ATP-binding protein [Alphaproteobacteria bacterium]|nr:ATP-binding protein [Alphaproteobacteria bacterium]